MCILIAIWKSMPLHIFCGVVGNLHFAQFQYLKIVRAFALALYYCRLTAQVRLRLGNGNKNKFFLAFALACTNFHFVQVRLRLGNGNKKQVFFAIPLALH